MTSAVSQTRNVSISIQRMESGHAVTPGRISQPQSDKQGGLSRRDFESFVREYTGRLLTIAGRFLRSPEDAADAVQDALLSAFASRETFQGNSTVYTWLYRIVVNVCLMRIRLRPRRKCVSLDELLSEFDENNCHSHRVSQWTDRPESRLDRDETRAAVRACIDRLPDDYRTILLLRDLEQMDTDETAALLNLSRSAVKTRLHRARQALRSLLAQVMV